MLVVPSMNISELSSSFNVSYNTGTINSEYFCGGIVGDIVVSKLKNCYDILNEVPTTGRTSESCEILNVVEKTLEELKQKETFVGFDFENVWKLNKNETPSFEKNIIEDNISIKYRTHIQDIGWQEWKKDGAMAGTKGQRKN